MATSGIITGTTSNEYIAVRIEWSVTQNKSANVSNLRAALQYKRTNSGYTTYGTGSFSIGINGKNMQSTKTLSITENAWVTALSTEMQIEHNDRGEASVNITGKGNIPGTTLTDSTVMGTINLDTIPRASTITSALDRTLGEACSVTWLPLSSGFTYKLNFSLGGWSHTTGVIKPNRTSSYTYTGYTLPLDVASQLPKATQGTMTVTLATYSDDNGTVQIGSNSTKTITVTVPNNASTQPTVSMSLSPSSNLSAPYKTLYIQGFSRVKADLAFGTKYGASVEASSITVNGKSYTSPCESDILTMAGKVTVKATVKDSRGYYGTNYQDIEVIPYEKPYVRAKSNENSIICARCDQSANFTDSGTYLKIKAKVVYSKVISSATQSQYNYGNIKFRYRKEGGAYGAWQTILNGKNSDEVITAPLLNGALDVKSNYQVQIVAYDDFYESSPITIAIPSDAVYMDRPAGGKSMGLGGYSSGDGNLDVHWKTKARGGLSLFDTKGDEILLDTTLPLPRGQVAEGWNPNNLENGAYVVTNSKPLKNTDGNVLMYNGVLIQMNGTVDGSVKIQLALTSDETRNPFYRAYWYGNWGNWRSMKL